MSAFALQALPLKQVRLLPSLFQNRFNLNLRYLLSLRSENLLQNHYLEAGLGTVIFEGVAKRSGIAVPGFAPRAFEEIHWGWESPTCQVRGQFLGHWLSAAARTWALTGNGEIKGKADDIIVELARCQRENGGEWAGSIPEKYMDWLARGKWVWAPQYVIHKTLMGLLDMYRFAGNDQALDILVKWANWFQRWTGQFSREKMDDILDNETGGMLEVWADLYGITGRPEHLELLRCYDRRRLFDRLLAGDDVLTNAHANTTIPEVQGAARAWEVTGARRWRDIAEAYWRSAVAERGYYCTGGQTRGEMWTPPGRLADTLGDTNQEHCTVYNMMRLADYLLRWTGDTAYADYWERNLYNGILAQQHPETGMVAYFLPLGAGRHKHWGTPTRSFWCCHGTLVQAHTLYAGAIYFEDEAGLAVCQYIPSQLTWERAGVPVSITQTYAPQSDAGSRPQALAIQLAIRCQEPADFTLKIRLPGWLAGAPQVTVNGVTQPAAAQPCSFYAIQRTWHQDTVVVTLPREITTCPLPDRPDTVAFLDGPVVLAGLCDAERTLSGDAGRPETLLTPDNDRWGDQWTHDYRTINQEPGLRFIPLYDVRDERYALYFPVRKQQ